MQENNSFEDEINSLEELFSKNLINDIDFQIRKSELTCKYKKNEKQDKMDLNKLKE